MSDPVWIADLQGLVPAARITQLRQAVAHQQARVRRWKQAVAVGTVIVFIGLLALATRLFPGLQPSDILKLASAIVAIELATVTYLLGYLPSLAKSAVDQALGQVTLASTYAAIQRDIGDATVYQKGITWLGALAVFVIAMLGFIYPDPPKP